MNKRLIAPIVGALAIVLIAQGCGGGDDDETTSIAKAAITKAEYLKRADAICTKNDKQIETEFGAYLKENLVKESEESEAESNARATEIIETILMPVARREIRQIRALGAPSGDEEQVETMIEAFEEAIERSEAEPVEGLRANVEIFQRAKVLAERYGLKVCGY